MNHPPQVQCKKFINKSMKNTLDIINIFTFRVFMKNNFLELIEVIGFEFKLNL